MSVAVQAVPEWLSVPADPNALDPAIWPASAVRSSVGELTVQGVSAATLAATYGTPLLVIDEEEVRVRASSVRAAFSKAAQAVGTTARVYYASKALLTAGVAQWVTQEGLGIDVSSGGELALAVAAGVDPAMIGFHGNNKSVAELRYAVDAGVGSIIIDSPIEVERLAMLTAQTGAVQKVLVRVTSGVHAETHSFLATAHEDQKFGLPFDQALALVARIRQIPTLSFQGLHCHIGSQIFGVSGFRESARRVLALHAQLAETAPVPVMNLGGGFGIAYTSADSPTPMAELAGQIVAAVAEEATALGIDIPVLAFEPGRWVVGPAGVTLYEVGTTKDVQLEGGLTRRYVSVDGGMSDNARPALYGAQYSARIASRVTAAQPELVRVVGKHCESGDIVVDHEYLPADVSPGDLLAVAATGAYCYPLASNYNLVPRPAVVAVHSGKSRVLVRRETFADVLGRDIDLAGAVIPVIGQKESND